MKFYRKISIVTLLLTSSIFFFSCEKQLAVDEGSVYLEEEAVSNPQQLQELLNSCYDVAANVFNGNYQLFSDLLSDDLAKPFNDGGTFRTEIWNRSTTIFNSDVSSLYTNFYYINYRCNLIDRLTNTVPGMTDAEKTRSIAEARFLRALSHFKILQLWAQPAGYTADNSHLGIVLRTKVSIDPIARSTVNESYNNVIEDLDYAIANLPITNGRYADIDAAKALKALVLFQKNDLNGAIVLLDDVMNSGRFTLSDSIDRYYPNNYSPGSANPEFIFGFSSPNISDNRGGYFNGAYRVSGTTQPSASLTNELYALIASDSTDIRNGLIKVYNEGQANQFIGTNKFDDIFFGTPLITLTQLYLVRAEVLARLGTNLPQAVSDVNKIIERAYPTNPTKLLGNGESADNIIAAVEIERRKEFFGEGERVHNMRRKGAFYNSSTTIRGASWDCDGLTLQFPANEKSAVFIFNPTGNCN